MFVMADDYPVPRKVVHGESPEAGAKLEAFIASAKKGRIFAEFNSVDDLKAKAAQALARLRSKLDGSATAKPVKAAAGARDDIPKPPHLYAKPPYLPGYEFQGRVKELAALKDWVGSPDPVLLFEAIGGMGKSMVTWQWVTRHAANDRGGWAGIFWYSFYERGADMREFCIEALSYMKRCARDEYFGKPTREIADVLLGLLRARPWLLVLDGLERVLVAYHRSDAAQVPDDEVEAAIEPSKTRPNNCIRPEDDDLLRALCAASRSKILISSRLMPSALLNSMGMPMPGVRRFQLLGLDSRDAELMLRAAGISGDGERMQLYLESQFGCHPLVVGVVGGLVLKHMKAPGDFDSWVKNPAGGAAVNLADPDIRQRQAHILKLAFEGLDEPERDLIARIAMTSNAVDWEVLEALNPCRPLPPDPIKKPVAPDSKTDYWMRHLEQSREEAELGGEARRDQPPNRRTPSREASPVRGGGASVSRLSAGICSVEKVRRGTRRLFTPQRYAGRFGSAGTASVRPAHAQVRPAPGRARLCRQVA